MKLTGPRAQRSLSLPPKKKKLLTDLHREDRFSKGCTANLIIRVKKQAMGNGLASQPTHKNYENRWFQISNMSII